MHARNRRDQAIFRRIRSARCNQDSRFRNWKPPALTGDEPTQQPDETKQHVDTSSRREGTAQHVPGSSGRWGRPRRRRGRPPRRADKSGSGAIEPARSSAREIRSRAGDGSTSPNRLSSAKDGVRARVSTLNYSCELETAVPSSTGTAPRVFRSGVTWGCRWARRPGGNWSWTW